MGNKRKSDIIGSALLLLTALIWGLAFSMQEMAASVPPFTLMAVRSAVAVLFLIPVILLFDALMKKENNGRRLFWKNGHIALDITRREWRGGLASGVLLLSATVLQQLGIGGTGAGKTGFITSLYMVIVPLIGLVFGKRIGKQNAVAVAVAVVGFYFISMNGLEAPAVSDLYVLACAVMFAIQILAVAGFSKGCDGVRFSFVQFLTCGVLSLPVSLFLERPLFEGGGASLSDALLSLWMPLLFLGILSSGVAYTLQVLGQQRLSNQTVASVLMSLENVFAALFAALIFPERRMSWREILGCAIVFVAVLLTQIPLSLIFKNRRPSDSDSINTADK